MKHFKRFGVAAASLTLGLAMALPASANSPNEPRTLVIGVGHYDPANQQVDTNTGVIPDGARLFGYNDFFTRSVIVHTGDVLDFQTARNEFHSIAVAKNETALRGSLPLFFPDFDPAVAGGPLTVPDVATGSGRPKVLFGPGVFAIFSRPRCGVVGTPLPPCTFDGTAQHPVLAGAIGGGHVRKLFQPNSTKFVAADATGSVDWNVTINAAPGNYSYLCLLHPGMSGTLQVVPLGQPTTTQGEINAASVIQFATDRAAGLATEAADNTGFPTSDGVGHTIYTVHVSDSSPGNHVGMWEMMPKNLSLKPGDTVHYTWTTGVEVHNVAFPAGDARLPQPQGYDCGTFFDGFGFNGPPPLPSTGCIAAGGPEPFVLPNGAVVGPEAIFDPGNAAPGTHLTNPTAVVDSGVLVTSVYGFAPSSRDWSAIAAQPGTYRYQCTVHDWMHGAVTISS